MAKRPEIRHGDNNDTEKELGRFSFSQLFWNTLCKSEDYSRSCDTILGQLQASAVWRKGSINQNSPLAKLKFDICYCYCPNSKWLHGKLIFATDFLTGSGREGGFLYSAAWVHKFVSKKWKFTRVHLSTYRRYIFQGFRVFHKYFFHMLHAWSGIDCNRIEQKGANFYTPDCIAHSLSKPEIRNRWKVVLW